MPAEHPAPRAVEVPVGGITASNSGPLFFIAGLCALESERLLLKVGAELKKIFEAAQVPWILKCSFDKANRSSLHSFRGPGLDRGLGILAKVKKAIGVPLLTDVHEAAQARKAAKVADVLQIPAFLC